MRIVSVGHAVFAATLIGLGIMGLVVCLNGANFAPIWDPMPDRLPAREALVGLCAVISLISGLGMLWKRTAAPAARLLFAYFLLWFLVFRLPNIVVAPGFGVFWPGFITFVMLAGAWVLYTWFATEWDRQHVGFAAGELGLRIARILYGLALIFFGMAHFIDLKDTLVLEPGWLPWHVFWAYFFGCTFIAAGLGVLIGVFARLAAALSTFQLGLFLSLIWVPIVAAGSKDAFQWSETIVSLALMAAAWMVADSYRGVPWLAVRKR